MVWVQTLESPRMPGKHLDERPARGSSLTDTSSRFGSPHSTAGGSPGWLPTNGRLGTPPRVQAATNADGATENGSPKPRKVHGARLPREGATSGGGDITVTNRTLLAQTVSKAEDWKATKLGGSKSEPSIRGARSTWHAGASPGRDDSHGFKSWHRRAIVKKQQEIDVVRELDQKRIAEKVEHGKRLREDRFERMLNNLQRPSHAVLDTAMTLRDHDRTEQARRENLYDEWSAKVYCPMESQIQNHLNSTALVGDASKCGSPGYMAKRMSSSSPQLGFEPFKLRVKREDDPAWRPISDNAWEDAFDKEATAVLDGFGAMCRLRATTLEDPNCGLSPAMSRSRPVLDPTKWGQLKLQSTLYGRFAQVCEEGPHVRMGKRGGPDIYAPSEADGVPNAGKRSIRAGPRSVEHHDLGMLRGDGSAWNGEASLNKTCYGASSAAPVQDHYTYEVGSRVTDVEFPLGKRMVPHFP